MGVRGFGDRLDDKTDLQLRSSARKIAQQQGLRSVPDMAHVIVADRRHLLLYIRKHWDTYVSLG